MGTITKTQRAAVLDAIAERLATTQADRSATVDLWPAARDAAFHGGHIANPLAGVESALSAFRAWLWAAGRLLAEYQEDRHGRHTDRYALNRWAKDIPTDSVVAALRAAAEEL